MPAGASLRTYHLLSAPPASVIFVFQAPYKSMQGAGKLPPCFNRTSPHLYGSNMERDNLIITNQSPSLKSWLSRDFLLYYGTFRNTATIIKFPMEVKMFQCDLRKDQGAHPL